MPALTLLEAAKLDKGNLYKQGVVEMYAGSSSILQVLPFENIPGGSLTYNEEQKMPGVGFRGVNESYSPTVGIINPKTEVIVIAGGELDVDKFIIVTRGEQQRTVQESMKIRALSLMWTRKFIKGDSLSDPREFDGLQTRVTGSQILSAGVTAGGAALSLAVMDEAYDQTYNPSHWIMSKAMARKFTQAARDQDVSGNIHWEKNELGIRVPFYNGIPILTVDLDAEQTQILGFDEAASSGAATATSIYCVGIGEDSLTGIQNGGMMVDDLGILQTAPIYRTRVEWYNGIAAYNGRSITRIRHIGNLAITK